MSSTRRHAPSGSSNNRRKFALTSKSELGLDHLDELAAKLKEQKRQQKLSVLSPFWARKQRSAAENGPESTSPQGNKRRKGRSSSTDFAMEGLKNLRELTREVPSQARYRSSRNFLPTSSFKAVPRFDEIPKRAPDGGFQSYEYTNDKGAFFSDTKRELKFPLKGQGANKYYEGCSTHKQWVDSSKAARVLQKLYNIPFGSRTARIFPFDVAKVPLGEGFTQSGVVPVGADAVDPEDLKEYKLSKRARNQLKRKKLAEARNKQRQEELARKRGSPAFRDRVKRDPYGLIPFGDGMSDFRQPGPGPGVSSPDRLALAKEVQKKAGGKFKGGNRATMPIIGADSPKIWTQPNTLDDLPVETITRPNDAVRGIAPIDANVKANNFPECIMPEKQGSDKLSGHKVWAPPPKDEHDKKGAQIHYAFGSYSTRFEFDALGKKRGEVEPSPKLLPSDFDVKNPGVPSGVFKCTEQRHVFGRLKEKKSTIVLEKHDLLDSWNVYDD